MAHCDISIAMQWASGPLNPKGKIRVSLPNKGYLLLMFIQSMWPNMVMNSSATKSAITDNKINAVLHHFESSLNKLIKIFASYAL